MYNGLSKGQEVCYMEGIPEKITIHSHGNTKFCNKYMLEINPTIGCQFQCQYCNAYTQEDENFFDKVEVYKDYPSYLEKFLFENKDKLDKLFFYFSPKIDALQPCLLESGITREILELFEKYGAKYFSVTKGKIPPEDIQELLIKTKGHNQIVISCTMPNESVRERLEPGAATIQERLDFAKFCKKSDIVTTAIFSPILPVEELEFVKSYIEKYITMGIDHFRVDFTEISKSSLEKLVRILPEYKNDFYDVYLDKEATITHWTVPYKEIKLERYWPSMKYMRDKFTMLRDYAKRLSPEATISVCNSLCVEGKLYNFNQEAMSRGYSCLGLRF